MNESECKCYAKTIKPLSKIALHFRKKVVMHNL